LAGTADILSVGMQYTTRMTHGGDPPTYALVVGLAAR